jgi:radical SAM-linked protein
MRLRIIFSKTGTLRYTGHLDLQSIWERTIRRAGLPLAYTQGFHPSPKIQIASALPLGIIGRAEIVDLWLDEPRANTQVRQYADLLQPAAPPGLSIVSVEEVNDHGPALQTQMASAEYKVTLLEAVDESDLGRRVEELLAATSLPRERRGKEYDLRPLIEEISLTPLRLPPFSEKMGGEKEGGRVRVFMRLAAREGATGRPEEVLDALGILFESTRIERTHLILEDGIK